jgi:DUF917 family protein
MPVIISDIETVEDFCWGLTFFGTGGGGRVEAGFDMLAPAVRAGRRLTLVSPEELSESDWTCWAIILGGKDPDEPPPPKELAAYGLSTEEFPAIVPRLVESARELTDYAGVRLGALVSMELSSAATAATIMTGLELGIPTVDGDYVGRAIPELVLNKMELCGRPPTPVVMVDRWGNRIILKHAVGASMADRIGRMVSRAAYGRGIATTGHLVQVREARPALVRGSLSRAIAVGAALRRGAKQRSDKLAELLAETGGRILFEGTATSVDWRSTEPYTFRELTYAIQGTGKWKGADYRIWVKNEHHAVWRDQTVIATSPDIVAVLDPDSNRPLTTLGDVTPGRPLVVVAMKALDPAWRSDAGQKLLGPRHFDLDFDYVDFEREALR